MSTVTYQSRKVEHRAAIEALDAHALVGVYIAAAALDEGEAVIRRAIREGRLPSVRLGRNVKIPSTAIKSLLGLD